MCSFLLTTVIIIFFTKVEVANAEVEESESFTCDISSAHLEETVDPGVESTVETAEQEQLQDSTVEKTAANESLNVNAAARRSTRKSLATMTATPKSDVSLSKVPMSESKLPLRRLRATQTAM